MFVEHGGCELFGEDASDRHPSYYLSEECDNALNFCVVEIVLECTGRKLFFILKMGHKRFFTILRFHFVSSSLLKNARFFDSMHTNTLGFSTFRDAHGKR